MACVRNAPFARVQGSPAAGGALLLVTAGGLKLRYAAGDVRYLASLAGEGKYRAVIDRTDSLADVVEAQRLVDAGRTRGNAGLRVHTRQGQAS